MTTCSIIKCILPVRLMNVLSYYGYGTICIKLILQTMCYILRILYHLKLFKFFSEWFTFTKMLPLYYICLYILLAQNSNHHHIMYHVKFTHNLNIQKMG
ncbi:hypothetical protein X975_08428, partial [Stegodyphus mimosarum]